MKRLDQRGFTAFEIIVILLLLGILVIAGYTAYINSPYTHKTTLAIKPTRTPLSVCDFQNDEVGCGLNSFKVVAPNGGEQICLGSTYKVQWTAPADMEVVNIVVGAPDTASNPVTLGTFPASQKEYDWNVTGIPVGSIYKLWLNSDYKGSSVNADSSKLFSIKNCT
jgi:hypothetical protein